MKFLGGALALLSFAAPAHADFYDEPLTYELDGYWKTRGVYINNLFLGQADYTDIGRTATDPSAGRLRALTHTDYFEHHLRLSPSFAFRKIATLKMDVDVLEGVIWGDNDRVAAVPALAGSPSNTDRFGRPVDSLSVRRVWMELAVPVGLLRVGRQPSHWGMGLLANAGDGLGADFGDFRRGSTQDRILFATRPGEIIQTLMGVERPKSGLTVAFAFDRIATDAISDDEPDAERACTSCAPQILLAQPNDDVNQWVGVASYKNEKVALWSQRDLVQAGVYIVRRSQRLSDTVVWIIDGYLKARVGPLGVESELVSMSGTTSALDGTNPKDISIKFGVARAGYYDPLFDAELEVGQAPGDDSATDENFTGYNLHADYNVGLLLYEEVLAARSARAWGEDARGLWSNGGVTNSRYVMPKVRWRPLEGLTLIGAFLWARANQNDAVMWAETREPDPVDLNLGWEMDLAARYDFAGRAHFKVEAGYFVPGRALWKDVSPEVPDLQITDDDQASAAYTVQARLGFEL